MVKLVHPVSYFKTTVASGMYPVSKTAVEKFGKKYGTASKNQYYDGPFVQKGWTGSNQTWKLVKNKYYWDKQAVKLQTVNYSVDKTASTDYNLYQSKKLDAAFGNKINVSVKSLPKTNRISHLISGTYQFCFMSLTTDTADPYEFLKYMHSSQTYNFGSWNNSAYERIVDASNSASRDKKRLQELAKA